MVAAKKLNRACAPLFLYLTAFRRNAASCKTTIAELQSTLKREIDKVRQVCDRDPRLASQFDSVHYALVAAADQVVLGSAWSQRAGWSMNLLETQEFGRAEGGREFYKVVDKVLSDPDDDAVPVAEVLFTCMALGFQGELLGERKELERRRRQLYEKARMAGALGESLTPEAYGKNATHNHNKLPSVGIIRMLGIALVAMLFAKLVGLAVTGNATSGDREAAEQIISDLRNPTQAGEATSDE